MPVRMHADYVGDLHCVLAHEPSGSRLETDAPLDNHGRGQAFSPTDLLGAALVSCALTTMAIKGPKVGAPLAGGSGRVTKIMTDTGPRRVQRLEVELTLPAALTPAQRQSLEEIARTCPVALSLSGDLELPMRFVYG